MEAQKLETTKPAPVEAKTPKAAPKERRTWTTRLDDAAGNSLEVRLERRGDGTWRTFVRHTTGTGKARKHSRGATEHHPDERSARAAYDKALAVAEKAGWRRHEGRGGFSAAPDAFSLSSLPKPATTKK